MNEPVIRKLRRSEISQSMLEAAKPFEERFQEQYESYIYFPKNLLARLHKPETDPLALPPEVTVASHREASILDDMNILKTVANSEVYTVEMKREYFSTLQRIYGKLAHKPNDTAKDPSTFCIGIDREGRILAQAMECLPAGRSMTPHAKRIPFQGGLIIGIRDVNLPAIGYAQCAIIDGAIASGSTIMAMLWLLHKYIQDFRIFSVHGPCEGLRAIATFGRELGVTISITVGHATVGLNEKYYAVDSANAVIVGDLGDTISDLDNPSQGHV